MSFINYNNSKQQQQQLRLLGQTSPSLAVVSALVLGATCVSNTLAALSCLGEQDCQPRQLPLLLILLICANRPTAAAEAVERHEWAWRHANANAMSLMGEMAEARTIRAAPHIRQQNKNCKQNSIWLLNLSGGRQAGRRECHFRRQQQ